MEQNQDGYDRHDAARTAWQAIGCIAALTVAGLVGCAESWLTPGAPWTAGASREDRDGTVETGADSSTPDGADSWKETSLTSIDWRHTATQAGRPAPRRWTNPDLIGPQAKTEFSADELRRTRAASDAIVAANALMLLAHLGEEVAVDDLGALVRNAKLPLPLRCAAVEYLSFHTADSATAELMSFLEDQDDRAQNGRPGYVAELHEELLWGLARRIAPTDRPVFTSGLDAASANVRIAALHAWRAGPSSVLPPVVVELAVDADFRVRAAAIRTLANARHPAAMATAARAVGDSELTVRLAAIEALGEIGGQEAIAKLRTTAKAEGNVIRAAAVSALAAAGDTESVLAAAGDRDARVRTAVAEALRLIGARQGAATATTLFGDRSMAVRRATIAALERWPLDEASPLLLAAMADSALDTRQSAAAALSRRWPSAQEFRPSASPEERDLQLGELRQQWRRDHATSSDLGEVSRSTPTGNATSVEDSGRLNGLLAILADAAAPSTERQRTLKALRDWPDDLERQLESLVVTFGLVIPDAVFMEVLPSRSDAFALLAAWPTATLVERRRIVSELVLQGAEGAPSAMAARRLVELVTDESDALLWQSTLVLCRENGDEFARRFAVTALGHPAPEVRRRACDYFTAHPGEDAVALLASLLGDEFADVVVAAAQALVVCGRPTDATPLFQLLGHADVNVRLAAAIALSSFGEPRGRAALERLARDGDPGVRARAVAAMGELAHPEFTGTLIALLDDHLGVRRAALAALPSVTGHTIEASGLSLSDQVSRWKAWDGKNAECRMQNEPHPGALGR